MNLKSIIASIIISTSAFCQAQEPIFPSPPPLPLGGCFTALRYQSNTNNPILRYYKMEYPTSKFIISSAAFWDVKTVVKSRINGVYSTKTSNYTYNPFVIYQMHGLQVSLTPIEACNKPNNYIVGQIWLMQPGTTNVVEYAHMSIIGKGQ